MLIYFVHEMTTHIFEECLMLRPKLDLLSTNQEAIQQWILKSSVHDRKKSCIFYRRKEAVQYEFWIQHRLTVEW